MAPTTPGSLHLAGPAVCLLLHLRAVQEQLLALPALSCRQWEDSNIWLWGKCLSCSMICLGSWKSEHPKLVISLCYYRNLRNDGVGKKILNPVYFLKSIMESKGLNPQSEYLFFSLQRPVKLISDKNLTLYVCFKTFTYFWHFLTVVSVLGEEGWNAGTHSSQHTQDVSISSSIA